MRLQHWIVSRDIDGKITDIGEVTTTLNAQKKIALAKAWRKFVGQDNFTIGWKLACHKGEIYEHARCPEANIDDDLAAQEEHQGNLGGITFGTYSI